MKKTNPFSQSGLVSLADTLRKYRLEAGFSQESVAKALGITRSAYTYYETGKTSPDPSTLNRISKIYKVPLEQFFPEEDTPPVFRLHDSGSSLNRAPKKPQIDPQKVGDLTGEEKALVAYLRSRNISGDSAMDVLKKFYDYLTDHEKYFL